jgi:hypothetical protein
MKNGRKATITAAIACMLSAPLAIGPYAASADELSDLRANQQLLQQRLDQLAQMPPGAAPGGPGAVTLAGSFPRSFLIPGTDTSLRVGGIGVGRTMWYLRGVQPSADLFGQGGAFLDRDQGSGGTGNLPAIPLQQKGASAASASHNKSEAFFIGGRNSRLFVDARTPTAWGQAQAYIEFDFSTSNNNVLLNGNTGVVPNNPARFRQGYATLGPWLLGTATGSFTDNDSDIEVIDTGGQVGGPGRGRLGQLRYTWASPWPGITVIGALEQPESEFESPNGNFNNASSTVDVAACGNGAASTGGLAVAGTSLTVGCVPAAAIYSAAQLREPAGVLNLRIDQPWGHLRIGTVLKDAVLNDGRGVDKTWIGYGGAISGDFKPFPVWSPKDDVGFSVTLGEGLGGYIANTKAVSTNWGGVIGGQNPTIVGGMAGGTSFNTVTAAGLANRAAYDKGVKGATITAFGAKLGYQHWWTPELRSNIDYSMVHQDVPYLNFTPGISGRAGTNLELAMVHANLLWSPVAFVTTGVEYAWGHRVVTTGLRGDSHVIQTMLRVQF